MGLNEDGLDGLAPVARRALDQAQVVFGGPRHLALAEAGDRGRPWPVPFDIAPVLALRGQRVVVLASGDPFWFGAGGSLAAHLAPHEWRCHAQPSTFSLVAARLGWRLEATDCLGLHASPVQQLLPRLAPGVQAIVLVRDGAAVAALADWLVREGWGASALWVMERVGGARERCRTMTADAAAALLAGDAAQAPVAVALRAQGSHGATALPQVPGRANHWYVSDGQITKAPARALTLAALAPRRGERLWDIGGGSGSVAVEWCLAGGTAISVEQHAARIDNIRTNACRFGLAPVLQAVHGEAPDALADLPAPQAVFVGGGFNAPLFDALMGLMPLGCRLVVNAVTLETEALLVQLQAGHGGQLLRLELSTAEPLGRMRSWKAARPLVQWSWQR